LYEGCCFLAVELVPPIYTTIATPDELAPDYFYDDTPYAAWSTALTAVECHDTKPAPENMLAVAAKPDLAQIGGACRACPGQHTQGRCGGRLLYFDNYQKGGEDSQCDTV
jgi:hypothetical protein